MPSEEIMMVVIFLLLGIILALIKYILDFKTGLSLLFKKYGKFAEGTFKYKKANNINQQLEQINILIEEAIKKSEHKLREASMLSGRLRSILKGTSNGIIAIDNEENILILNNVAKKIIGCKQDFEGLNLEKVIINEDMLTKIREKIYMPKEEVAQISFIDGRYYRIEINRIKISNDNQGKTMSVGKVINISDITEKHMLETLRTEFVTSVTHELRTPVTSILGFIEAIRESDNMDDETRDRFLGIVAEESNRLRTIIDDILTLSFVENTEASYKEVDVERVIQKVIRLLDNQALKKNIFLIPKIESKLKLVTDEHYLYQMLINLLENAIKYSEDGRSVEVIYRIRNNTNQIVVKDYGRGIATEDQVRIFERFYRVDKSRSGKERGTGLGLAIVKHMAMAVKATVDVKSILGEGSEFIIEFKDKQ
ncbi:MAG: sensor histidine kinase [Filifactoraceae bacterium]